MRQIRTTAGPKHGESRLPRDDRRGAEVAEGEKDSEGCRRPISRFKTEQTQLPADKEMETEHSSFSVAPWAEARTARLVAIISAGSAVAAV